MMTWNNPYEVPKAPPRPAMGRCRCAGWAWGPEHIRGAGKDRWAAVCSGAVGIHHPDCTVGRIIEVGATLEDWVTFQTPGNTLNYMNTVLTEVRNLNDDISNSGASAQFKRQWEAYRVEYLHFYNTNAKGWGGWTNRLSWSVYLKTKEYQRKNDKWRDSFRDDMKRQGGTAVIHAPSTPEDTSVLPNLPELGSMATKVAVAGMVLVGGIVLFKKM